MKGINGLIIAAVLGIFAAALNWFYIENKTADEVTESFLGVADGAVVKPGQTIKEADLVEVKIPTTRSGNLREFVHPWEDLATIVGTSPTRELRGGDLVMRIDMRTPPTVLALPEEDDRIRFVSPDERSYVPQLINPGDSVSFIVPQSAMNTNRFRGGDDTGVSDPADSPGLEIIGPFEVVSIGDRIATVEVDRTNRRPSGSGRGIGIIVKVEGNKQLDAEAAKLIKYEAQERMFRVLWKPKKR